jgi:sterol desaturase/sphingolipid hydroxylase (fatty acid hydroxylase superfamily)
MLHDLTRNWPTVAVDLFRLCLWLAILSAIFVPLERLFALHPGKVLRKGIGADLGYYFLSGMVASLLLSVPLGTLAWAAHQLVPWRLRMLVGHAPVVARFGLALLAGEIGYYWGHRLMHTVPLLWRFHAIHHSPEHIDFLVNSRAHPLDLTFSRLCTYVPIYALSLGEPSGMGGSSLPLAVALTGTVWTYFIHANVRWRFGVLEWIVSTPRYHHWHHALDPADRNYSSLLPMLDRIFGTLHLPAGRLPAGHVPAGLWPERYGIRGEVPEAWSEQLVLPLLGTFPLAQARNEPPLEISLKA